MPYGGARCAVTGCNNKFRVTSKYDDNKKISYFTFPKEPNIRQIWIRKCDNSTVNSTYARICSEHFKSTDFPRDLKAELLGIQTKRQLISNAIPSLKLPFQDSACVESSDNKSKANQSLTPGSTSFDSGVNCTIKIVSSVGNYDDNENFPANEFCDIQPQTNIKVGLERNAVKGVTNGKEIVTNSEDILILGNERGKQNSQAENILSYKQSQHENKCTQCSLNGCNCDAIANLRKSNIYFKNFERSEKQRKTLTKRLNIAKHRLLEKDRKIKLQRNEITAQKRTIRTLNNEIQRLQKIARESDRYREKYMGSLEQVFTPCQIKMLLGKKKVNWEREDIANAFTLRYLSKRAYVYLREKLKIPLPGISTLQHYASQIDSTKSLIPDVLSMMKSVDQTISDTENLTVLTFDEESLLPT